MENLCINNISFSINAFLLIQHLLYNNMKKRVINACMHACTFKKNGYIPLFALRGLFDGALKLRN